MFDAIGRAFPVQGEQRLLFAVLQEAIGTFKRYAVLPDRRSRRLFREVDAWFVSEDTDRTFAFVSVCDALGIDVAYVRSGLRQWSLGQRAPREAGPPVLRLLSCWANGMPHRANGGGQGTPGEATTERAHAESPGSRGA